MNKTESSQVKTVNIDVTILMPCLNEVVSLPDCVNSAKTALNELRRRGLSGEIIIADNGSSDGSRQVASSLGARVVSCELRGYGNAILRGVKEARGKYIVMGDADGSYDFLDAVPMVLKLVEGFQLCMGSRFKGKILPGAMPWRNRYIGNPALTGLLNLLFRSGISDAHCGLRAFTKEAFLKMRLLCPGMEFASEMVVKAAMLDLKRAEVPITLHPDKRNRPSHLKPWHDGKRHVKFLLMYSPLWIFFTPSIAMIVFGLFLFTVLIATPPYQVFGFGQIHFGDHWMILASGIICIGFQGFCLGIIAFLYRVNRRGMSYEGLIPKLSEEIFSLQNAIFFGTVFIAIALGMIAYVVWEWSRAHFGALYRIREMVIATTFLVAGLQAYFSVLLAVMIGAEND